MMKAVVVFAVLLAVVLADGSSSHFRKTFNRLHQEPPPPPVSPGLGRAAKVETKWITQKLDHYDKNNDKTWQMRYLSNEEHFKAGGPIFIFVGGEWEVSNGYLIGGHMYDMAKEHNGSMFYTEHRYYGKSQPTENLSTENLKYLDVKQALYDLSHFISTVKKEISGLTNSKVILVGGSYSATMVTWFQRMFPGEAVGSWASSAPLLAKVNFVEYKEVTGQSIRQMGGEACYNRIENAVAELESMMFNNRAAEVKALFKLCNNFNPSNDLDVYSFFGEISDIFAGIVQTHRGNSIQKACADVMKGDNDVEGLATFVLKQTYNPKYGCVDVTYQALVEAMGDTSDSSYMMRQWFYQTCNEYGWYQTSGSKLQPFGTKFPEDLYINACKDAYSEYFTKNTIYENIAATNEFFGALNPGTDNVYFTHGQLDPWRAMGLQEEGKATVIPEHAHCMDFGSISDSDTAEMKASKVKVAELVRTWLK
ncbi:hypothetical protein ACFFRR_009935 [Megaselia abdita]